MMYSPRKVKELLDHQGRSQDWLAERIGYTPDHLSRCLTGKHHITPKMAAAIAQLLDVPEHWLLEEVEEAA